MQRFSFHWTNVRLSTKKIQLETKNTTLSVISSYDARYNNSDFTQAELQKAYAEKVSQLLHSDGSPKPELKQFCESNSDVFRNFKTQLEAAPESGKLKENTPEETKDFETGKNFTEFNNELWKAAYATTLATWCSDTNFDFLRDMRMDAMAEAANKARTMASLMRTKLPEPKIISLQVEYHSIVLEIQSKKFGTEKWCQAERAFLESTGANNLFIKK